MTTDTLADRLVDKSIEAFIMGLEIYNKPTIKYRIEGFSFFIINAWELMLKAKLLKDGKSIYFNDKPDRSLSVENVIRTIYTDKRQPLRINLEKIIELRNISTHFITEDYEAKYAPLFQAAVLNFTNELKRFHDKDVTEFIAQNFLTLSATYEPLTNEQIKIKYPPEIAEKLILQSNDLDLALDHNHSDKFAIDVRHNLFMVKKKEDADFLVKVDSSGSSPVKIVRELKDPANTHKYSHHQVVEAVNHRLKALNIDFEYVNAQSISRPFSTYTLDLFIKFYNVKSDGQFAYNHKTNVAGGPWTYSQQFVEFIVDEIKKDPDTIVESLQKSK